MRALLVLLLAGTACVRPASFHCATDTECTRGAEQGTCEAIGRCSFPDPACTSGWRFADLSGDQANQCVGDQGTDAGVTDGGTDSSTDAAPDAPMTDAPMTDAPTGCPAGYAPLPGVSSTHLYRKLVTPAGWTNQRTACGNEPANVYLAIPNDAIELQALATLATADFWVGISDAAIEGMYVDVHGAVATFLPWAASEPDNNGNQDCVRARSSPAQLETLTCGTPAIAICECEP